MVISKISNNNGSISLSPGEVKIEGISYTYVNGFTKRQSGQRIIPISNLLSATRIKARSKKLMFSYIIIGLVVVFIFNLLNSIKNMVSDTMGRYPFLKFIVNRGADATKPYVDGTVKIFLILMILACALFLGFIFSRRCYIELAYIGGVVRFNLRGVSRLEAENFIRQIYKIKSG